MKPRIVSAIQAGFPKSSSFATKGMAASFVNVKYIYISIGPRAGCQDGCYFDFSGPTGGTLERDDFSPNHHPAPALCLSMILFRKPVPTFRDHALSRRAD